MKYMQPDKPFRETGGASAKPHIYDQFLFLTMPSQVKLLITKHELCIVQRATSQSKTGFFRDYGAAEAPPGFQAAISCRLTNAVGRSLLRSVSF
jgi:hypothetical protein